MATVSFTFCWSLVKPVSTRGAPLPQAAPHREKPRGSESHASWLHQSGLERSGFSHKHARVIRGSGASRTHNSLPPPHATLALPSAARRKPTTVGVLAGMRAS